METDQAPGQAEHKGFLTVSRRKALKKPRVDLRGNFEIPYFERLVNPADATEKISKENKISRKDYLHFQRTLLRLCLIKKKSLHVWTGG